MGLTEAQLTARKEYLGGTDMARLAGVSRYGGPLSVWLEKTGQSSGQRANPQMALGTLLEPVVADLFSAATGLVLRRPRQQALRDSRRPWLGGNIDRYATPRAQTDDRPGIFEAKWAAMNRGWGDGHTAPLRWPPPPAVIPPDYAVQVQHYLGLTGREVAYVGVLLGYADFRWYALPADPDTIAALRELGTRFWHDNVLAGVPPEPDGTEAYSTWLRDRWQGDAGEVVATPQQVTWADQWASLQQRIDALTKQQAVAQQHLQTSMRDSTRLVLPAGHITWKPYEETRTDWKALARLLASGMLQDSPYPTTDDLLADMGRPYQTTTTKRPFKPHLDTEEEAAA